MNEHDVLVFSDGSGYEKDGHGGWSAMACTLDRNWCTFRMGAIIGTTVDRAEMTGMLEGLQMAWEMSLNLPKFVRGDSHKASVLIHCDRENVVLAIKKVYDRTNAPDLWARFEFYEKVMDIQANHVMRETDFPEFQQCDLHASTGRLIAKDHALTLSLPIWRLPHFQ